jgi:hypothetical protein
VCRGTLVHCEQTVREEDAPTLHFRPSRIELSASVLSGSACVVVPVPGCGQKASRAARVPIDRIIAYAVAREAEYWQKQGSPLVHNRPISVHRLGEMPMQSCGQSVSAPRGKSGARLNAHTDLRVQRHRSAREAIYRNRPMPATSCTACTPSSFESNASM